MSEAPILEARRVGVAFEASRGVFARKTPLRAVREVSFAVRKGESFAIVGESGSGKTTLANALLNILTPGEGEILFKGRPVIAMDRKQFARQAQPVFQDPYSSLNPKRTLIETVMQPLRIHRIGDAAGRRRRAVETLELVGLPSRLANALPRQLSGGQRQRVAIARALVMRPEILVCDEPTSALDVSVQAQILNLLQDLRSQLALTYILITHNLSVVEHIATRVAVMYFGRIVEEAPVRDLFGAPKHPYTVALLKSALSPDPDLGLPDLGLSNLFPDPLDPPTGCHFHPRCNRAFGPCARMAPKTLPIAGRKLECHLYDPEFAAAAPAAASS